uniref:Uncharacterized protein LOC111130497 n=1 Tax=Crassostrea virginica TaxID=6565 RepID=A0A8B8E0T9_CRAVI|nr:uncharacterized protein LOC111130497 [Crassostrea virginica]
MLKPFVFLLALLQGVCLAREGKRILLNDPALIEQRLSHLEQKIQTLESENRILKDRQNQYEATQIAGKSSIFTRWDESIAQVIFLRKSIQDTLQADGGMTKAVPPITYVFLRIPLAAARRRQLITMCMAWNLNQLSGGLILPTKTPPVPSVLPLPVPDSS